MKRNLALVMALLVASGCTTTRDPRLAQLERDYGRWAKHHAPRDVSFERSYMASHHLQPLEEKAVIALAEMCGVTNIAWVSTGQCNPDPLSVIDVQGVDSIDGRTVTYRRMEIWRSDWTNGSHRSSESLVPSGPYRMGYLWVHLVYQVQETLLQAHNETFRVRVQGGIPIDTADKILRLFLDQAIVFDPHREDETDIDYRNPWCLEADQAQGEIGNRFIMEFGSRKRFRSGKYRLTLILEENRIRVVRVTVVLA